MKEFPRYALLSRLSLVSKANPQSLRKTPFPATLVQSFRRRVSTGITSIKEVGFEPTFIQIN